jgi:TRAP-type C4-dicarboxylate transport system permease small subunit
MFVKIINMFYRLLKIIEDNLVVILLGIMVVNVSVGVFCRYVLNNSLSWTEEFARYLMVWFAFIGMAIAFRDESHVNVSVIVDLFPSFIRQLIKIISYLVILWFLDILFLQTFKVLRVVSIQRSPAIRMPMMYPYLSVTFGSFLMSIEVIRLICASARTLLKK